MPDIKWTDATMPREPTEEMLVAARDWSQNKYGKPIGNDAAIGCWQAMFDAGAILRTRELEESPVKVGISSSAECQ